MSDVIDDVLNQIKFFEAENYENMSVIGVNIPENNKIDLMSLKTGLDLGLVEISEISKSGSINEVKVINNAVTPLLLLDGEEIIGSKQNRIINTTIIIPGKSEKIIPVSCTESGRWNYTSKKFRYSEHMASSRVRQNKLRSVTGSLRSTSSYQSNQSEVWRNIADTAEDLELNNETNALYDSYTKKGSDIDDYRQAFNLHEKQNGLIVYINGKLVGFELIYNSTRYKEYHNKIIESYIIDAISKKENEYTMKELNNKDIVDEIRTSKREKFDSVGLGMDYRFENDDIEGSAVIYQDNLINASFFMKT